MKNRKNIGEKIWKFFRPTKSKIIISLVFVALVMLGFKGAPFFFSTSGLVGDTHILQPLPITLFQPLEIVSKIISNGLLGSPFKQLGGLMLFIIYYYLLSCIFVGIWNTRIGKKAKIFWRNLKSWQRGGIIGFAVSFFILNSKYSILKTCWLIFGNSRIEYLCSGFTQYIFIILLMITMGIILGLINGWLKTKTSWRNLKYWQKGGLIGLVISTVILSSSRVNKLVCEIINSIIELYGCGKFGFPILSIIIGLLIGFIVGKIKKKKNEK